MFRKPPEDQDIKRMADLLCQGSTLTDLACPACSSPLFKLKNEELWCGKCEKKVVVVKEGEDPSRILSSMALANLEATLLAKIQDLQDKMQHEESVEKLLQLNTALSGLLDNLGKLRKTKGK